MVGLLWMLLWGMILSADAGLIGVVGGIGFIVAGVARLVVQLRARRRIKCEPGAAPNGGPATLGNSGVTEGPPSVSSLGHLTVMPFSKQTIVPAILAACPEFSETWGVHRRDWEEHGAGESPGDFTNASAFVHEVIRLYESGQTACFLRFFGLLERVIIEGDEDARGIAVVGYLEGLQTAGSWKDYGPDVFIQWMGPESRQQWQQIHGWWAGGKNLIDIAVEEAQRDADSRTAPQ